MAQQPRDARPAGDAVDRTLAAVRIAVALLLREPAVNRAMMGTLGARGGSPGAVGAQSRSLWSTALADFDGIEAGLVAAARLRLPTQLALVFRGCLSFWVGGEIADVELPEAAEGAAAVALAPFVGSLRREALLTAPGGRAA